MTQIQISHVFSTDKIELEEFLFDKTLSQVCLTDEDKPKGFIVDERSTEKGESECVHINVNKQKCTKNETDYEEPSVIHEFPIYFNIFECGRNI